MTAKLTAKERIAAAEERRAKLREEHEAALEEQQANDHEALAALEAEHGFGRVQKIDLVGWKAGSGAATMVVFRVPSAREMHWKRYEDTVSKAKQGTTQSLEAAHLLARACLVYPSEKTQKDLFEATIELAPGVLTHLALQIAKAVQGNAEEEKKG